MLLDDEGTPKRDHHENAQQTAKDGHEHDAGDLEIESEDHDRGHGDTETEGDRFTGRARCLHDVIFQDGGVSHPEFRKEPEEGDGDDRDRNRGADREPDLEDKIERRGAKDDA